RNCVDGSVRLDAVFSAVVWLAHSAARSVPTGIVGGTVVLMGESMTNDGERRRHTSMRISPPCRALWSPKSGPGTRESWSPYNYVSARLHERSCFFAQLSASCFGSCSCLCLLERIFKHQLSELMFDGDCRRKFEFFSEPVRAHWPLLWASTLRLANLGQCDRCTPALAGCQLSRRDKCQVSKKAGACSGLLYFR